MGNIFYNVKARAARRLASSHIAGEEIAEALRVCRAATRRGWKITLCPWERPSDSFAAVARAYRMAVQTAAAELSEGAVSVKFQALGRRSSLLRPIAELAEEKNVQIRLDSNGPEGAPFALAAAEELRASGFLVRCTLPSRWRRSIHDAERLIALKIPVRVVRGQWIDPGNGSPDFRTDYLRLIDRLARGCPHVSVATHDRALAVESLGRLQRSGTPCELEQFLGLPPLGEGLIRELRVPKRLYVPYGHPYMPYNSADLWQRPAIAGWMVRDLILGRGKKIARFGVRTE
jgi:proline dehydrogenase